MRLPGVLMDFNAISSSFLGYWGTLVGFRAILRDSEWAKYMVYSSSCVRTCRLHGVTHVQQHAAAVQQLRVTPVSRHHQLYPAFASLWRHHLPSATAPRSTHSLPSPSRSSSTLLLCVTQDTEYQYYNSSHCHSPWAVCIPWRALSGLLGSSTNHIHLSVGYTLLVILLVLNTTINTTFTVRPKMHTTVSTAAVTPVLRGQHGEQSVASTLHTSDSPWANSSSIVYSSRHQNMCRRATAYSSSRGKHV